MAKLKKNEIEVQAKEVVTVDSVEKPNKKKQKNGRKIFWILIGIGVLILTLLIILSSVLSLGERLRNVSVYLEYAFYLLSVLLVFVLIVNPLRVILLAPTFSVVTVLEKNNSKTHKTYKMVSKNIIKNEMVSLENVNKLKEVLNNKENLIITLNDIFEKDIKKQINKIIVKNAKTVLVSTAISQNGRFDMLTVLCVNLKMISQIVDCCGFRPSYAKLGKLSVNVLSTALIAEGLEGLDLNEIFPNTPGNFLNEVPFVKPIASSIFQGISNALLTIRIGIVTRRYLFTEYKQISKELIRKEAIKESVKILPSVITASLVFLPEKIKNMFVKKEVKDGNN